MEEKMQQRQWLYLKKKKNKLIKKNKSKVISYAHVKMVQKEMK